jgi:low temperature requirement protein LtrA
MGLVFAIWWWYFDSAQAVAERHVRTRQDAVRFHVWGYGHLPLYLGIAVAGVGVEHAVTTVTQAPLHATEAWIFGAAVVAIMGALTVIDTTSPHARSRSLSLVPHGVVAAIAAVLLQVTL